MPLDFLNFNVRVLRDKDEDNNDVPVALVAMLVNGLEPLPSTLGRPYDPLPLLVRRADPGEFEPYTCSCGVPDCAGLGDPWKLRLGDGTVSLEMPATQNNEPRTFAFAYDQYVMALDLLQEELTQLEAEHSTLELAPFDGRAFRGERTPLPELLTECRARHLRRELQERALRLGLGELADTRLELEHRGLLLEMHPQGVSQVLFPDFSSELPSEHLAHWKAVAGVIAGDLRAALSKLEWNDVTNALWGVREPKGRYHQVPSSAPEGFWAEVSITMTKEGAQ
jgi:hypothetical protein